MPTSFFAPQFGQNEDIEAGATILGSEDVDGTTLSANIKAVSSSTALLSTSVQVSLQ